MNATEVNVAASAGRWELHALAGLALKTSAQFWFLVALAGQWLFLYYVAAFYGTSALQGNWDAWNTVFPRGHIPGDTIGNVAVAVHILLAIVIAGAGPLQLVPQLRSRAPAFHRWNGRIYLLAVSVAGIAGLYQVWVRGGTTGDFTQKLGISLDAILILFCAAQALRYAVARQFAVHRRWALRLFMVASAVWFFRIGLMFWILVNQGVAGFDPKTFTGPFLSFLSFADYLVPLVVLEIYFRVRDGGTGAGRLAMAGGLFVLTLAMGVGIFGAAMGMWLPRV